MTHPTEENQMREALQRWIHHFKACKPNAIEALGCDNYYSLIHDLEEAQAALATAPQQYDVMEKFSKRNAGEIVAYLDGVLEGKYPMPHALVSDQQPATDTIQRVANRLGSCAVTTPQGTERLGTMLIDDDLRFMAKMVIMEVGSQSSEQVKDTYSSDTGLNLSRPSGDVVDEKCMVCGFNKLCINCVPFPPKDWKALALKAVAEAESWEKLYEAAIAAMPPRVHLSEDEAVPLFDRAKSKWLLENQNLSLNHTYQAYGDLAGIRALLAAMNKGA